MAMTIESLMDADGSETLYSTSFRQTIEDHLGHLKEHPTTTTIAIEAQTAHKNHGDLVGVLQDYDIPRDMHWTIMRMNDWTSPMEYREEDVLLLIPSRDYLMELMRVHRVGQKLAKVS